MRGIIQWQHSQPAIVLPGVVRLPLCSIQHTRRYCTSVSLRKFFRNNGRKVTLRESYRCANRRKSALYCAAATADPVAEAPTATASSFEGWRQKGSEPADLSLSTRSHLDHPLLSHKYGVQFEAEYPAQENVRCETQSKALETRA